MRTMKRAVLFLIIFGTAALCFVYKATENEEKSASLSNEASPVRTETASSDLQSETSETNRTADNEEEI